MNIGIPKEIKPGEGRVALVPPAVHALVASGHEVTIEAGAGVAAGYIDATYVRAGARIVPDADAVWRAADLIVKVKEPINEEWHRIRSGHTLFCFLHLAALPELAKTLQSSGATAIAFETVTEQGALPLLAPMSEIAGRLAVHIGANLLHGYQGGRGILLGGMGGAERGNVVVLGAGNAGSNAAAVAQALGANVTVIAPHASSLDRMHRLGPNVTALPSWPDVIARAVTDADLLVGSVLVPGDRAPKIVTEAMVRTMRAGSVIVDISVDQGGCIETTRPTDWANPTYVRHGVLHFAVTNMPGAVPVTASQTLSASLLPYVLRLVSGNAIDDDPALRAGVNVASGRITHPAVAHALRP